MQYFKGDAEEIKFYESIKPITQQLLVEEGAFAIGSYYTYALGDILWDSKLTPLSNAIAKNIFRESFSAIFESFVFVGTFESYLIVFRAIFGDSVEVVFNVPGPGRLQMDITASGASVYNFVARSIVGGSYFTDTVITEDLDNIIFQTVKGFESEFEVNRMLFEMVPDGIFTEISLTIG